MNQFLPSNWDTFLIKFCSYLIIISISAVLIKNVLTVNIVNLE